MTWRAVTHIVRSFPAILASVPLVIGWLVDAIWISGDYRNGLYQLIVVTVSSIVTAGAPPVV